VGLKERVGERQRKRATERAEGGKARDRESKRGERERKT
jgi:hypothetical protein